MSAPQDLINEIRTAVHPIVLAHMENGPDKEILTRLCVAMATVIGTIAGPLEPKEFTQVVRALFGAKGTPIEVETE